MTELSHEGRARRALGSKKTSEWQSSEGRIGGEDAFALENDEGHDGDDREGTTSLSG